MSYMSGTSEESRYFLHNIRKYNSCFNMTSFGATSRVAEPGFMSTFKIQGQIYHKAGSLLSLPDETPSFLQIYFAGDEDREVDQRCTNIPGTKRHIVLNLQTFLHHNNLLLNIFKMSLDKMRRMNTKLLYDQIGH
jgi:hypothetical protein